MIFDCSYVAGVSGHKVRTRQERTYYYRSMMPVEVPVIAASDAPVVCTLSLGRIDMFRVPPVDQRRPGLQREEVRRHPSGGFIRHVGSIENAAGKLRGRAGHVVLGAAQAPEPSGILDGRPEMRRLSRSEDEENAVARARIVDLASKCAVIEGSFWCRTSEPVLDLAVGFEGRPSTLGATLYAESYEVSRLFRIDALEDALAEALALGADADAVQYARLAFARMVIEPGHWTAPEPWTEYKGMVSKIRKYLEGTIGRQPTAQIFAWARMRDAYDAWVDADGRDVPELVAATAEDVRVVLDSNQFKSQYRDMKLACIDAAVARCASLPGGGMDADDDLALEGLSVGRV